MIQALPLLALAGAVILVLVRPGRLPIWAPALAAALLDLALGAVRMPMLLRLSRLVADPFLTLLAVFLLTAILARAGFFARAARRLAAGDGGLRAVAFRLLLLTAGVAALFNNDGAALTMTPLALAVASEMGLSRRRSLTLLLLIGYVADAGSLPLVVSNLTNILAASYLHLGFVAFAGRMVPADLLALLPAFAAAAFFPADGARLPPPPPDPTLDRLLVLVPVSLLALYVAGDVASLPTFVPSFAGLGTTAFLLRGRARLEPGLFRQAPWGVFPYAYALFVATLPVTGVVAPLGGALGHLPGGFLRLFATAGVASVGSALTTNLPALLVLLETLPRHGLLPLAAVLGADAGTKWTFVGSLATLLWLPPVERAVGRLRWVEFARLSLLLTPISLGLGVLGLLLAQPR